MAAGGARWLSVDFEVFGKVQGVFFRKVGQHADRKRDSVSERSRILHQHTRINAVKHGLLGWVMNTDMNTVTGQIQGESSKVQTMKTWLRTTGSPKSRIEKCVFTNERNVNKLDYKDFRIRK